MRIILIGYGKMGRMVEQLALAKGHEIMARIDNESEWENFDPRRQEADVAIEFTQPDKVLANVGRCLELGIPVVTGTTGWHKQLEHVKAMVTKHDGALLYATNFSIGMNLFFELNRRMAALSEGHEQYRLSITEIHHTKKLDQPSGSAITLAEDIIGANRDCSGWINESASADHGIIPIESIREGNVTGIHIVRYRSSVDMIELKHEAFSRQGFAEGALRAAEWLQGRKGCYEFRDLLFGRPGSDINIV